MLAIEAVLALDQETCEDTSTSVRTAVEAMKRLIQADRAAGT